MPTPMRRPTGLLALMLLVIPAAQAAGPSILPTTAPAAAAPSGPEPIATADIPLRADADERFAEEVIARSNGRDPSQRLAAQLDDLSQSVLAESRAVQRDELRTLSITRLESLERHWQFYERELDDWRRSLQQASTQYNEDAAELAARRAAWEATRTAAGESAIAPALAERIDSVVSRIDAAERAVSGPIGRQIELGRRGNALEASIQAGAKRVGAAIAYNDRRLAQVDSPTLWDEWSSPQSSTDAIQSMTNGLKVEQRFLKEYSAATETFHIRKAILGALLLPLLLWLSWRSRRIESDDPEIQASTRVLRRPLSSWLVLMMASIVLFEPRAPILMLQVAMLVALVPVLRLLPAAVYGVLGPWPYVATGLYLLHRIGFLFLANPLHYRVYLLAMALLAAALVGWALWSRRPRPEGASVGAVRRLVRLAGWISMAAMLVAAGSNVIGNVSLAEMLVGGIVESGYIGLVLYAGVSVVASIVRLLLARRSFARFRVVTQHVGPLTHGLTQLLKLGAFVAWVVVTLNEFRVYRPIRDAVVAVLTHSVGFGRITITLGGVLTFLFSVWLTFWVARTVRVILKEDVLPKMSLPRGVANSVSSMSYYAMVLLGLLVALAAAGFEVSQLALVLGALGVGIGLGLQNVVNNFVSGLILMFERPIQPGDIVDIGGTSGKVREIGMRATTLSTFEGADVVVPNGMLLNEKLINWTLSDNDRRIDVNIGVAYGSDPRRVLELLMEVTRATPGIATEPEPTVLFVGFGASSLDFSIRAWTNNFSDWVKTRSELNVRVNDALRMAGIEIPFPQQDVHVRSVDPAALAGLGSRGSG